MEPASVNLSLRFNRVAAATLALAAVVTTVSPLYAQARNNEGEDAKQSAAFPTSRDLAGLPAPASSRAARHASIDRDAGAASAFYRAALRADPKNSELLDRAFISSVA